MTTYREPVTEGYVHWENCPEGAPDRVLWVCEFDHWLASDIPPGGDDRCPVVLHDATSDGRCYGRLKRPECLCEETRR